MKWRVKKVKEVNEANEGQESTIRVFRPHHLHVHLDTSLILPLLLVYRQITTVSHMLKLVLERYDLPKSSFTTHSTHTPSFMTPSDIVPDASIGLPPALWLEVAQPVQMRTVNILKLWVMHYWYVKGFKEKGGWVKMNGEGAKDPKKSLTLIFRRDFENCPEAQQELITWIKKRRGSNLNTVNLDVVLLPAVKKVGLKG